jgi:hypothetical protein
MLSDLVIQEIVHQQKNQHTEAGAEEHEQTCTISLCRRTPDH